MKEKWIFQDIRDAQEQVLYRTSSDEPMKEMQDNTQAYCERLRETVEPETYVRYELWTCDIYVDMEYIIQVTTAIYGDKVNRDQIIGWAHKHAEGHHVFFQ